VSTCRRPLFTKAGGVSHTALVHDTIPPIGFRLWGPDVAESPVVVAVPHAGRHYPDWITDNAALPVSRLSQLEDRYADLLALPLAQRGATVIVAETARAWIDLNRDPREIDPAMILNPPRDGFIASARTRSGLGLIPRRLGGTVELWRSKLRHQDVQGRIAGQHLPYHQAIHDALASACRRFGMAILLDCHSMPPLRAEYGDEPAGIVIGDRFGRSASPALSAAVEEVALGHGQIVSRNDPYAGGYSLDLHGRPTRNIHAIQIETDRSLYLDDALDQPGPGLERMQAVVAAMFDRLSSIGLANRDGIAAE